MTTEATAAAVLDHPRRLRRRSAAEYLGVTPGFLEKAAVTGNGPPYLRISAKLVLYDRADLDAWLASKRVQSTAEARVRLGAGIPRAA
jgi:hypothetical protein